MIRLALIVSLCVAGVVAPVARQQGVGAGGGRSAPSPFSIVGQIVDPAGRAVSGTFVGILRHETAGPHPFAPVDVRIHAMTDERGHYRLDCPYAGEFYLIALPHNAIRDDRGQWNHAGYGDTFYPGVAAFAPAKVVRVEAGVPTVANVTLTVAKLSTVTGRVMASSAQSQSGGVVELAHGDGWFGLDSRALVIHPDGMFVAPGLQPGVYFLQFHESQWSGPRGEIPKVSQARIVVTGDDISNVQVVPLDMIHGTGHLVVDPRDRPLLPRGIRVGAQAYPSDGNPGPTRFGDLQTDLTFEFRAWPVPSRIAVSAPGWRINAVHLNGVDITGTTIDVIQGKDISGLEIELVKIH